MTWKIAKPTDSAGPFRGIAIAELARRWGVSSSLIRKLIRLGELAHHRIGKRVLVDETDAAAFLASRRKEVRE